MKGPAMVLQTAETGIEEGGVVSYDPFRIYTGLLGQIGDIICFTPTLRRLKELFPNSRITFAVSRKYLEAAELLLRLPYVHRIFITEHYFERLSPPLFQPFERGWPMDLRGDDEVAEQRRHDMVFETRPRHRRQEWWKHFHQVEEMAHMVGVPGPISRRTEITIPVGTRVVEQARGKIIFHNDPAIDPVKAWPWELAQEFLRGFAPGEVVLLGGPGPEIPDVIDLRCRTTLAHAAALIRECRCYVGIDSGLMWIAGSLQVPTVGLYGTAYLPVPAAIQPVNPRARYLQAEGTLHAIAPGAVRAALAAVLSANDSPVRRPSAPLLAGER